MSLVQVVALRPLLLLLSCSFLLLAAGCDSGCRDACRHMLTECGVERAEYGIEDCEAQCELYLAHYDEEWQEKKAKTSVRCIAGATCEDLRKAESTCYDEAVFVW